MLAIKNSLNLVTSGYRLKDKINLFILIITSRLASSVDFERWINKYITLKEGNVFLDIGSHVGKYTIQAGKIVGDKGTVIAIEAHPLNYKVLNDNIKLNHLKNVKTFNIAAWNKVGKYTFYEGISSGRHSLKNDFQIRLNNEDPEHKSYTITAKPIDDIVKSLNIKVDFVKVDAGGAEFEILQGLKQTLLNSRPTLLVEIMKENQKKTTLFLTELNYQIEPISNADDFIAIPV